MSPEPKHESTSEAKKIWRYSDLSMFISMLEHQALFFRRASFLNDPFEGSIPIPNLAKRHDQIRKLFDDPTSGKAKWPIQKAALEDSGQPPHVIALMKQQHENHIERQLTLKKSLIEKHGEEDAFKEWAGLFHSCANRSMERHFVFVNCWHANEFESAAMWKLYGGQENKAICIQSSLPVLRECLDSEIAILPVHYLDYDAEEWHQEAVPGDVDEFSVMGTTDPERKYMRFLHKRRSFKHEQEVRALFTSVDDFKRGENYTYDSALKELSAGRWVGVKLDRLIEKILVDPVAPEWFVGLVEKVSNRYGVGEMVHPSDLCKEPVF